MKRRVSFQVGMWAAAAIALGLSACETLPRISTETAPGADLTQYHTYNFYDKPSTDRRGYKTITTRNIQDAVDREMRLRGLTRADNPDLKINFDIDKHDKITTRPSTNVGFGYGYGWRSHYGYDIGFGNRGDVETVTEGTLTIDVVDRAKNELVWSGAALRRLDSKTLAQPRQAIDQAVNLIFAQYPVAAAGGSPPPARPAAKP
jgi:Domain of unknown function (DUF4136)